MRVGLSSYLTALCCFLSFCSVTALATEDNAGIRAPLVETVLAQRVEMPFMIHAQGYLQAVEALTLSVEVPGIVQELHQGFFIGGTIPKGETVLRMDQAQSQAQVQSAQASVASAAAIRQQAERTYRRQQSLFKKNLVAQSAVDDAKASADTAIANERQARAALTVVQQQLAQTILKAPFDLQVMKEMVSVGQYVTPGQPLAEVLNPGLLEIELHLSPARAQLIHQATSNAVQLPEFSNVQAFVHGVAPGLDPISRTVSVLVRVPGGKAQHPELLIGDYITVALPGRVDKPVYELPNTALRRQGFVFQVESDQLVQVPVQVLTRTEDSFTFMSEMLNPKQPTSITKLAKEIAGLNVRVRAANE